MLTYIAGPFSQGNTDANVRRAINAAAELDLHGIFSIVPHRNRLDELLGHERPYARWLAEDLDILVRCDAVLRIEGESPGADCECDTAEAAGIPVFTDVGALVAFRNKREGGAA